MKHNAQAQDRPDPTARKRAPKPVSILVPLDRTAHARVALPVARTMARLLEGTLHIIFVAQRPPGAAEPAGALEVPTGLPRDAVVHQRVGDPATNVLDVAGQLADTILVLCTHTAMEKPYGALGSVAERILFDAPCPIMFVQPERGEVPWELHRALLPHNGTPTTAAAFGPAADLARRAGAELILLHAAGPGIPQPSDPGTYTTPRYVDQPQHEWPSWAWEFLDRVWWIGHLPPGLELRLVLACGEPGSQITEYARDHDVDLIILAWHGRREPERALTLKTVIRRAPCPVLVRRVGT